MIEPPHYFEKVRRRAAQRWDQLDRDPELAGPWHQLFNQVQSPRHVLSELLQNADDAGATEAIVRVQDGEFVFVHDGGDFSEEHFASLCRFGYSNKRTLHTIGFRGIGFKCTFSLGDEVRLLTPTLSVAFRRERFTQPVWMDHVGEAPLRTEVHVSIKDEYRERELQKNLQDWLASPISLLFFRQVRRLKIGDHDVEWIVVGPGPVEGSTWMRLSSAAEPTHLLLRSSALGFPEEALAEIRQERLLAADEEVEFPPCQVEIVLGSEGRLYVVLPTGVATALPFACNGPFVQDPARVQIKDPETSPTNRWLLQRVGELAAWGMLGWLKNSDVELGQRAAAYGLLPNVDREAGTLEGTCAALVELALDEAIGSSRYLLTETGELTEKDGCVACSRELLEVWSAEQVSALFDQKRRPPLCRHVSSRDRKKLLNWGSVEQLEKEHVVRVLQSAHPPKPESWRQLLTLWAYVSDHIARRHFFPGNGNVRIFPVQGREVLYAASEVVRLGERKLLQSDEDWEFLAEHLLVLNQYWLRFLAAQRREAKDVHDKVLGENTEAAYAIMTQLDLEDTSNVDQVIGRVANAFFSQDKRSLEDCVRLAQIAATLNAAVGEEFRFVTRDRYLRKLEHPVVCDLDGSVEPLVNEKWAELHLLHWTYFEPPQACTTSEWQTWVASGRSGLQPFAPLVQVNRDFWGRSQLRDVLKERGAQREPFFPYVTNRFTVEDWDFAENHWRHWEGMAKQDSIAWGRVLSRVLQAPQSYWGKALSAKFAQIATTGKAGAITQESLLPAWLLKFRRLPCLRDTRGVYREPTELLRRTPETESLLDVEPFVDARLDTEASRPLLVKLGVRDTATGSERLLERLRALARADKPPVHEVEKWYRRLDQLLDACSTDEVLNVKKAFASERIILSENSGWVHASEVFLNADEDDEPGAAIVRASVRELMLWRKIDVADRPSADRAIAWLKGLSSERSLSQDETRRVRALLSRHAERVWRESRHWLNLDGQWIAVSALQYGLSMQSLTPWKNLFPSIKRGTADFQMLSVETLEKYPFRDISSLASRIEERIKQPVLSLFRPERKPWLVQLGAELRRAILDSEGETNRVRKIAARLAATQWQQGPGLETIPYIDETPAGPARRVAALWDDKILFVEDAPMAQLVTPVSRELGRTFGIQDVTNALMVCFERSPEFVSDYIKLNFTLAPPEEIPISEADEAVPSEQAAVQATCHEEKPQTPEETQGMPIGDGRAEMEATEAPEAETGNATQEQTDISDVDQPPVPRREPRKPPRPDLIEIFARKNGFRKDAHDRFYRDDGSWIARTIGTAFPWEHRAASGALVRYYLPKSHCLRIDPLELPAEVWGLCDKFPDQYSLILTEPDGSAIEISGRKLQEMCAGGELTLYPATFRLVYSDGRAP